MSELRSTGLGERDIRNILGYIARDNPRTAATLVGRVEKACQRLARFPRLGTRVNHLSTGTRVFSIGSCVIYYHEGDDGVVRIVRVAHGARDEGRYSLDE